MTFRQGLNDRSCACHSHRAHSMLAPFHSGTSDLPSNQKQGRELLYQVSQCTVQVFAACHDSVTVSQGEYSRMTMAGKWNRKMKFRYESLYDFLFFLHLLWHVTVSLVANRPEIMYFLLQKRAWGKKKQNGFAFCRTLTRWMRTWCCHLVYNVKCMIRLARGRPYWTYYFSSILVKNTVKGMLALALTGVRLNTSTTG